MADELGPLLDAAERQARRRAKVAAALAAVSPCPYEWTGEDGSPHLCYLLGTPGHRHMCSCGEFEPEAVSQPDTTEA